MDEKTKRRLKVEQQHLKALDAVFQFKDPLKTKANEIAQQFAGQKADYESHSSARSHVQLLSLMSDDGVRLYAKANLSAEQLLDVLIQFINDRRELNRVLRSADEAMATTRALRSTMATKSEVEEFGRRVEAVAQLQLNELNAMPAKVVTGIAAKKEAQTKGNKVRAESFKVKEQQFTAWVEAQRNWRKTDTQALLDMAESQSFGVKRSTLERYLGKLRCPNLDLI